MGMQSERIIDAAGECSNAIEKLFGIGPLLLDEAGHCRQEWLDTAAGPAQLNLADWIAQEMADGRIRFVSTRPLGAHRRVLVQLGLSRGDMKWFNLCRDGTAQLFLTEDIDFFDPRAKCFTPARRERIKRCGPAPVKRFFQREIGTSVVDLADVRAM